MNAAPTAPPGTVVRYTPAPRYEGDRQPRWCREGIAIADKQGLLVDTFWGSGSDNCLVSADETDSIEVLFHLDDFDELDRWRPDQQKWSTYAPGDRGRITSQHGLQQRLFIRKGAIPARRTMIENAVEKVMAAEAERGSAQRTLVWAQEDLAALLAAPGDCTCRPSQCDRDACAACADTAEWTDCKALPARLAPSKAAS